LCGGQVGHDDFRWFGWADQAVLAKPRHAHAIIHAENA
jgi:hypothetical protein